MNYSDLTNLITCEVQFTDSQSTMYMYTFYILIVLITVMLFSIFYYLNKVQEYIEEVRKSEVKNE